jgi:HlyD family type I secretion membrane fusion protein
VGEVVGAFESDTVAVFQRTSPSSEHIVLYVLASMVMLAVVLSAIVKLDRVVTSTAGIIATTAESLYVSALGSGVVRKVNVRVGQVVRKGQALATLDPTLTHADVEQLQQHLQSDEAAVAREEAEVAGAPYHFSTNASHYQTLQGGIWQKRQEQYRADVHNFDSQIKSVSAQMSQALSDAEKYRKRLKIASDAEEVYQPLLEKGYVSKLQVMQSTDVRTEMSRLLADAENQVSQYRETMASLKAQRESYIQKWHSDTANQLVTDRNDLDTTRDGLVKAQKLEDLNSLSAPVDAVVLKIGKVSQGSIAPAGGQDASTPGQDPLFTLVPLNVPVEADIHVLTQDVSFIRVGDPVTLKLDAYPFIRHGTAKGVVQTISEGSFSVDENNTPVSPYFKVRVKITGLRMRGVPTDFRLVPGMTLIADILVGRRTILSYLVEGALRTGSEAMREPN